jgi:hypothetical protein
MAPGTSGDTVIPIGKSAKTGKDGKSTKEPKEGKKPKDDSSGGTSGEGKNSTLLRQMATDIASVSANLQRLQSDVDTLKGLSEPLPSSGTERGSGKKSGKGASGRTTASGASATLQAALTDHPEIVIAVAVRGGRSGDNLGSHFICAADQMTLSAIDTAHVAKLGYAFSSVPKIALIRMLLENGEQTAAQLGEGAGLTTGSLYHHLRELVHAEVAYQSSRNRYALTDLGRRSILLLLALKI